MSENRHTIRNLNRDLIIEAKIHVLQTRRSTLGELVNDAIALLIEQETDEDEEDDAISPAVGCPDETF